MFVRGREVKFNIIGASPLRPPILYWLSFSAALIAISVVVLLAMGVNLGIEFRGGYLLRVLLDEPADVPEVRGILDQYAEEGLDRSIVQTGQAADGPVLILRMPYIEDAQARRGVIEAITGEIDERYGIAEMLQEEQVGSEWGREVSSKALIALAVFLVVILIYITLRLEFKMAVAAIAALVHDSLITVGVFSLTGREVTPVTVIAFLTILGYSLYDTIVVFDRVEENANLMSRSGRISYAEMVNESVNQSLVRSIGTTLTTLIPIVSILIFGGETLKDFAFALFLGVLLGGYSSIFVASPLLAVWKEREPRYAAVRDRTEARGAREAILATPSRTEAAGKPALAADDGHVEAVKAGSSAREESEERERREKERSAGAKPAAGSKAQKAAPASSAQRKKSPTTRGPSGGKKKKKKKKKR